MISLTRVILENNVPALSSNNLPIAGGRTTDLDEIKRILAEDLDMDPEDVFVGKVPAKSQDTSDPMQVIADYMDMGKTGDIYANFDISRGTDEIARDLTNLGFLEDIMVNGCSGQDLCGIISDGSQLAGNLVITSKTTEAELIPFMRSMGMLAPGNNDGGFENYWRQIGGRIIGEAAIKRMQQNLAVSSGIRGGRQLGGPNRRMLPGRR